MQSCDEGNGNKPIWDNLLESVDVFFVSLKDLLRKKNNSFQTFLTQENETFRAFLIRGNKQYNT